MRSHHLSPDLQTVRLVFVYKNFAASKGISHIGLGVAVENTSRVLRRSGFHAEVWPITSARELELRLLWAQKVPVTQPFPKDVAALELALTKLPATAQTDTPVTHIVVSAPWIPTLDLAKIASDHPEVAFAVTSHSNVGFLQADANGVKLIRQAIELQRSLRNFSIAGNSQRFCDWLSSAYHTTCEFLPNLYDVAGFQTHYKPKWSGDSLLIGCFGAIRPLKNTMTAAAAALEMAARLNVRLEFWVSGGRAEGGGQTVLNAVHEMLDGEPGVQIKENNWQSWAGFRRTVREMDLLLQPSYTESFNMVTADGIAEGVPSVVSEAIDWAPDAWKCDADDALDVANKGIALLHDQRAAFNGQQALAQFVKSGVQSWSDYLLKVR